MPETREQWIEREARKARERCGYDDWDSRNELTRDVWRNVVAPYYQEPLRVPVDVDGLADAIRCAEGRYWKWEDISEPSKKGFRKCARAALAYLNIEPCAKPEYDPADVALTPNERAELENLRAECKRLRTQQNETRPVKVRCNLEPEDISKMVNRCNADGYSQRDTCKKVMDHVLLNAVLEVPPGVPTLEELRQIGTNAYYSSANLISNDDDDHECARTAAIRDAVIAGIQMEQDVEELAKVLYEAPDADRKTWAWGKAASWEVETRRNEARAALAWFDGKRGEV